MLINILNTIGINAIIPKTIENRKFFKDQKEFDKNEDFLDSELKKYYTMEGLEKNDFLDFNSSNFEKFSVLSYYAPHSFIFECQIECNLVNYYWNVVTDTFGEYPLNRWYDSNWHCNSQMGWSAG